MKRIIYIFAASVAASLLFSCERGPQEMEANAFHAGTGMQKVVLTASLEDDATKTARHSDGAIYWKPEDEISLFYGSGSNGGSKFTSLNEEETRITQFSGAINIITLGNDTPENQMYFWGVYPYNETNSCDATSITTTLPDDQYAIPGTFDDDLFITMGHSTGLDMSFKLVCSGMKFTVTNPDIAKIVLSSLGGEPIAGTFKASFDEDGYPVITDFIDPKSSVTVHPLDTRPSLGVGDTYYIITLPAVLESGMRLTFYKINGDIGVINIPAANSTLTRGTFKTANNIDASVQYNEPVDLGFGVLWAPFNVGAAKPSESGDFFALGETARKSAYTWENYLVPGITALDQEHDAAYQAWGEKWRTPTPADFDFLVEHTTHEWVDDYNGTGVSGYLMWSTFTGYTDKCIFIPVTGYFGTTLTDPGNGYYRLNSDAKFGMVISNSSIYTRVNATSLFYCSGMPVRPVQDKHGTDMWLTLSGTNNDPINILDAFISDADVDDDHKAVYTLRPVFDDPDAIEIDQVVWSVTGDDCIQMYDSDEELYYFVCTAPGIARITATAGNLSASCQINSYEPHLMVRTVNDELEELPSTIFPFANDHRWSIYNQNTLNIYLKLFNGHYFQTVNNHMDWEISYEETSDIEVSADDSHNLQVLKIHDGAINVHAELNVDYGPGDDDNTRILSKDFKIVAAQPDGSVAVDLGLSTNWAPYNLGSGAPQDYGVPFAWGEIYTKDEFTTDNQLYFHNNEPLLPLAKDAARVLWGGDWRMPTIEEWNELNNCCEFIWQDDYNGTGVEGYLVRSCMTGYTDKSIFIPLAENHAAAYHSSTYSGGSHMIVRMDDQNEFIRTSEYSYAGLLIRPVSGTSYVSSVSIQGSSTVNMGTPLQLSAVLHNVGHPKPIVVWSIDNPQVASVSENGLVTGLKVGTATVTVTVDDDVYCEHAISVVSNVTSVTISGNETVQTGGTITLTATVQPASAFSHDVVWSVDNECVATITQEGVLTALTPGVVNVTATSVDGATYSTRRVTVTTTMSYINLDLPSGNRWAIKNIGAALPTDVGTRYAWGETGTKHIFSDYTYSGDPDVDIATLILGPGWRTPTRSDWEELFANTTKDYDSHNSCLLLRRSAQSLTIPFAPAIIGSTIVGGIDAIVKEGYYWTSSADISTGNTDAYDYAYVNYDSSDQTYLTIATQTYLYYYGLAIRAVYNPNWTD